MPPEETPQVVHVTQEVVGRSVKLTASVTVRKPGPEQYGFQEFSVYYSKEYPVGVDALEARNEVAQETVAALFALGGEYKAKYEAAHKPSTDA